MEAHQTFGLFNHLTHKANLKHTRYGWLRLTPAYSVHLVSDLLDTHREENPVVLDPFCGTGTTALVCAERGVEIDTTDINPFLVWLAQAKTRSYKSIEVETFENLSSKLVEKMLAVNTHTHWMPPLFQIEKWWDQETLGVLSRAMYEIKSLVQSVPVNVCDLLKVAFCRMMIERANVSFGHQSMSFKKNGGGNVPLLHSPENDAVQSWKSAVSAISQAARSQVSAQPNIYLCDARSLTKKLEASRYTCVITSPPYPNRMSYIRELRPYMYWLGYLVNARDAGDLDWQAIGGTWGYATSHVGKWKPEQEEKIPFNKFQGILAAIAEKSPLLSRYVHKYFYDMVHHARELYRVVKPGELFTISLVTLSSTM